VKPLLLCPLENGGITAPSHRREVERQFWVEIATGITSEKAAEAVGVSQKRSIARVASV